ncbi:ABC transporter permease [Arthrobacter sp. NPDC080073]|uniref:ABC transporter permease n=1 Tax=Arthrobacter sp. NPDC080073 TaxID=3155919 RepID=UPI00343BC5C1
MTALRDVQSTPKVGSRPILRAHQSLQPLGAWSGVVLGVAGILAFLFVWQLTPVLGWVNPRFLPPAGDVLARFVLNFGLQSFWVSVGQTLTAWLLGLLISVVAGIAVGLIIGSSTFLRKATHSTIEFLRPIPSVGLIPLAVLLFGLRMESELLLIVYACFWIMLIQTLYGVADVDKVGEDTAKSFGLGIGARIRYLVWPTALPYIATGIRLAATVALILAITGELIIGTPGLGSEVAKAQANGAIVSMYSLVVAAGLIGVLVNLGMRAVERRALFWHSSVRAELPV